MNERHLLRDEELDRNVYLALLALTAATLAASSLRHGRLVAVCVALAIAGCKAALIGFYYMDLRRERGLTYVILGAGFAALLALLVGILPDVAFYR